MPTSSVRHDVERWTRVFNRRRSAERLVRAAVFLGIAAVLAVGLQRLVLALMVMRPGAAWLPDPQSLGLWVWSLYAAGATVGVVYTAVRAWQHRIDVMTLATRLDREHQTHDVLATAIALDRGEMEAPSDLAAMVRTRARSCSASLRDPVPPFTAPSRALASAGAVAAAVALLPASAESLVDLAVRSASAAPAEHSSELADPTLSPESLERLERSADALADLERRPGLHESARDRLRSAREQLEALGHDPSRSLARLSRAEQSLRDLQRQRANEGLYDQEQLQALGQDELAESMTEAIERREDDTAAAMAEEMARRVQDADNAELASMATSLDRALGKTPSANASDPSDEGTAGQRGGDQAKTSADDSPNPESGRSDDAHQRWRKATEGLPEQMRAGEADAARDTLRNMAEEMAGSGARPGDGRQSADGVMERALDDIRRARSEQLAEMNRELGSGDGRSESKSSDGSAGRSKADGSRGQPGEASDESEGQPGGAGVPFGMPGGRPGPGGGVGSDALGDPKDPPLISMHGADRVEARPDGTTQGSVAVIQRFTEGHRDDRDYEDLHHEYEAVAESAVRREQIPLTRRDYIRNYFQAVRPR